MVKNKDFSITCFILTSIRWLAFALSVGSANQLWGQAVQSRSLPPQTEFQLGDQAPVNPNAASNGRQGTEQSIPARSKSTSSTNQGPQPLVLLESDQLKVIGHFQAGMNAIAEGNVYWNLAEFAAPTVDFDSDPEWLEVYVKPGISFERAGDFFHSTYGKLSFVSSGTLEIDAFDRGNTGRTLLEEGYLGFRTAPDRKNSSWDFSFGPRELKLGTGMLVANGAQNGFERGALKFGPRQAWEFAAIGKLKRELLTTTLFYLDANELRSNDRKLRSLELTCEPIGKPQTIWGSHLSTFQHQALLILRPVPEG